MMHKLYSFILFILAALTCHADNWNIYWREDFGVVEDSVIKDFPDPSMTVPNHDFDACEWIYDGAYGIANSTWWAFIRKKDCNPNVSNNFTAGGDHTRNKDGAMLIVNVGSKGNKEPIYEQEIKIDICPTRTKYKFSIYAACVSFSTYYDLLLSNLTLNILNVKDPDNPVVIKSMDTGDLPLWTFNDSDNLNPDGIYTHAEKEWGEYSLEFEADAGDVLRLQVLNNCKSGIGNDFVLDDITLYRLDDIEIAEPIINSDIYIYYDNAESKCEKKAIYEVSNTEILNAWHKIYPCTYFLWQVSKNDGLTWENQSKESGQDALSMGRIIDTNTPNEIYRLIITGGNYLNEAKKEAEYIAKTGRPSNGCTYFSISSTIAPVKYVEEIAPVVKLGIDGDINRKIIFPDDCDDPNETHYFTLSPSAWDNIEHVEHWEFSTDGLWWWIWDPKNGFNKVKEYDITGDVTYYFRVILARTENEAHDVDMFNHPGDRCNDFFSITDTVAIVCKEKCQKPDYYIIENTSIATSHDGKKAIYYNCHNNPSVSFTVKQREGKEVYIDSLHWYVKNIHDQEWSLVSGEKNERLFTQLYDTTQVLFLAWNGECQSDSIIYTVRIYDLEPELTVDTDKICEGDKITFSSIDNYPSQRGYAVLERSDDGTNFERVNGYDTIGSYHEQPYILSDSVTITDGDAGEEKTYYYRIKTRDSEFCSWVNSDVLTVNVRKKPDITLKELPEKICEGSTVQLDATGHFPPNNRFAWLRNGDTLSSTEMQLIDTPQDTTIYEFIVADEICSTIKDTVKTIVVKSEPLILNLEKDSICEGEETTINVSRNNHDQPLIWEYATDASPTFVETTFNDESHTEKLTESTYFRVKTKGDICPDVYSKSVYAYVEKKAEVSIDHLPNEICDGEEIKIAAHVTSDPTVNSHKWIVNSDTLWDMHELILTEKPQKETSYIITVFGEVCPPVSDSIHIEVSTQQDINIDLDKDHICEGDVAVLSVEYDHNSSILFQQSYDNVTYEDFTPTDAMVEEVSYPDNVIKDKLSLKINPQKDVMYRVKSTTALACASEFSAPIEIKVEKRIEDLSVESLPTIVCKGTAVNLKASATLDPSIHSFTWSKNGQILSSSQLETNDIVTETSNYEFTLNGQYCPPIKETLTIDVDKTIDPVLSVNKDSICVGEEVTLSSNVQQDEKVIWEESNDNNQFHSFTPLQQGVATPSKTTYYRIGYSSPSNICSQTFSNSVLVHVDQPADVSFDPIPTIICEGTAIQLNANVTTIEERPFSWSKGTEILSTSTLSLSDTPTQSTTYQFTIQNGKCPDYTKEFQVEYEEQPVVSLTITQSGVCEGDEIILRAKTSNSKAISWQEKNDEEETFRTIQSQGGDELNITAEKSASYRVVSTGSSVCSETTSAIGHIEVEKKASAELPEKITICPKGETTLLPQFTSNPSSISWYKREKDEPNFSHYIDGETSLTVSPMVPTEYKLEYTMKYCPMQEAYTTILIDEDTTIEAILDEVICAGETVQLKTTVNHPETMVWEEKNEETNQYNIIATGTEEITVSPTITSEYRVSKTSENGCNIPPIYTTVTVHQPVDIELDDKKICKGDSVELTINGIDEYTDIIWTIENADSVICQNVSYIASPEQTTNYQVIVKNGTCQGIAKSTVIVYNPPIILSCEELTQNSYRINVEADHSPIYFDYGNGQAPATSTILTNIFHGKTYTITASDEIGCSSTYVLDVPAYDLYIPEYFIVENGNWKVGNLDKYENSTYQLYDRFGKKLFDGVGTDEGWNGEYNGNPMPSTDYWYVVNIPEIDQQYRGHFTLIREK